MNDAVTRAFYGFLVSVTGLVGLSCARKAEPSLDPMHTMSCDTTPMKPLGRVVDIPEVKTRANSGALTGTVVQEETGDAIEGAVVDLIVVARPPTSSQIFRYTNPKGGFSFDSLDPAIYRARVRRVGEQIDTATIRLAAGKVDTLRLRMRAFRCYGY